jgi:hypothetical protein
VYTGCDLLDIYWEVNAYEPTKRRGESCHEYFDYFSRLVFQAPAIRLGSMNDNLAGAPRCLKSLIVGQNYVFNVDTVDKQRAITLRKGRDLIMSHLNQLEIRKSSSSLRLVEGKFFVLLLPKNNPGFQEDQLWSSMCDDVQAILTDQLGLSNVLIVCNPSGSAGREEEMLLINSAAMIIAEHGTLSLLAGFYGGDGAVLVSIGRDTAMKSAETLPYALHIYTLFTTTEKRDSLPSLLKYGVEKAAMNIKYTLEYHPSSAAQ